MGQSFRRHFGVFRPPNRPYRVTPISMAPPTGNLYSFHFINLKKQLCGYSYTKDKKHHFFKRNYKGFWRVFLIRGFGFSSAGPSDPLRPRPTRPRDPGTQDPGPGLRVPGLESRSRVPAGSWVPVRGPGPWAGIPHPLGIEPRCCGFKDHPLNQWPYDIWWWGRQTKE